MTTPDLINGAFELLGSVMLFKNVAQILKDKETKGVYWPVSLYFTAWGFWNLFYYPHLDQWLSFIGGAVMCFGNVIWCCLAWHYCRKNKKK